MASIESLGIHKPSALGHLIAEGHLQQNPDADTYKWTTYIDDETQSNAVSEEILATESCVAWSRGGQLHRTFDFIVEQQKVAHAILTWFPAQHETPNWQPTSGSEGLSKRRKISQDPDDANHVAGSRIRSRALVIFLKLQAHVYFLSGASHVVNLPFEVEKVLPAPIGLVIQRRLAIIVEPPTPLLPSAPQNSFYSSHLPRTPRTPALSRFAPIPQSATGDHVWASLDFDSLRSLGQDLTDTLPRHFAFTDPLADMSPIMQDHVPQSGLTVPNSQQRSMSSLDRDEEILYVSSSDELRPSGDKALQMLTLVVTQDRKQSHLNIWQAVYSQSDALSSWTTKHKQERAEIKERRRSSFRASGFATPAPKGRQSIGESLAGTVKAREKSKTRGSMGPPREPEKLLTTEEVFASQIDLDLQGRKSKEGRRVSSFLSRAEVSSSFDRYAYQDLAASQTSNSSSVAPGRRGHSFGGPGDGYGLGVMTRARMRASMPGVPPRSSIDDSFTDFDSSQTMQMDLQASELLTKAMSKRQKEGHPFAAFRREMTLYKIGTIPLPRQDTRQSVADVESTRVNTELKIFTIRSPTSRVVQGDHAPLHLFIAQHGTKSLHHVQIRIDMVSSSSTTESLTSAPAPSTRGVEIEKLPVAAILKTETTTKIIDAHCVREDAAERLLLAQVSRRKGMCLTIAPPWALECALDLIIDRVQVSSPFDIPPTSEGEPDHDTDLMRTEAPPRIQSLQHALQDGTFDVKGDDGQYHRIRIKLRSNATIVSEVIELSRAVLPPKLSEWLQKLWWISMQSWAHESIPDEDALILSLLVFIQVCGGGRQNAYPVSPSKQRPRKSSHASRTSGASAHMPSQIEMWASELDGSHGSILSSPAWSWMAGNVTEDVKDTSSFAPQVGTRAAEKFVIAQERALHLASRDDCFDLVKLIEQKKARGAQCAQDLTFALHLLYEEHKLDQTDGNRSPSHQVLLPVLAQCGYWLDWQGWNGQPGTYYGTEIEGCETYTFDESCLVNLATLSSAPRSSNPPSILAWIETTLSGADNMEFPTLQSMRDASTSHSTTPQTHNATHSTPLLPLTRSVTSFVAQLSSARERRDSPQGIFTDKDLDKQSITMFTDAAGLIVEELVAQSRVSASSQWPESLLRLVGRQDLLKQEDGSGEPEYHVSSTALIPVRDVHAICHAADQADPIPPMAESDRIAVSRLIFSEDRRFIEALRMIEPVRVTVAECQPDPSWDEAQLLEAQKEVVSHVMIRTFALAPGLAMAHYASRRPLMTEKFIIHGYSTMCIMRPLNNTVMADRTNFTEERYGWAWFHAGVAAGLAVSPDAEGIDTSWIVFNKPNEPNHRHAGLIFALGMNGHLRNIARWLAFKYLSPKHTMTSIGLLLGMSASYMGTMDTTVTRLLSVHVTRMLPPGAAELNLSPLAQTAGLMGIGLLYHNTQHRRMSEIMLSEIENLDIEDPAEATASIRDECYRLAAGFALGYINLGQGSDLQGLRDMHLVERLLAVAVGPKPVNTVHVLQQASAGATMALALVFMKTNNKAIARKIDVPDTAAQFEFVRPDILLLRTMAKHIILWDDITPSESWITSHLPKEYHKLSNLSRMTGLESEHMALYCVLSGILWSISLKYTGSCSIQVRDLLLSFLDHFIRICRLPAVRYDAKLTRNTARNCQDLLALCAASVMAGTGDLQVMRRLRRLHGRVNSTTPYGSHLAAHMALGVLFIGGGSYSFSTSNLAIASLIVAFYPLYPTDVTDNKAHLQALRHFWVLAAENRCLLLKDISNGNCVLKSEVLLTMRDGTQQQMRTPCIIPGLDRIARIQTLDLGYWPVEINFLADEKSQRVKAFRKSLIVYVQKRSANEMYDVPFAAAFASGGSRMKTMGSATGSLDWTWLLKGHFFTHFQPSDLDFVMPNSGTRASLTETGESSIDQQLSLVKASRSDNRQDLWNLRVIFAWYEWWKRQHQENGGSGSKKLRWIDGEFFERLRAEIEERLEGNKGA